MNGDLRPLGIGEILDAGIKLSTRHWRTLVPSVACLILPVQILSALITASVAPEQFDVSSTNTGVEEGEEATLLVAQLILVVLYGVSALLATAVCFKAVADAYLGSEPDWRRSLRFAGRRLWGLIGVALAGGLMVLLGLFALVIPAIWLAVAYSVSVPALLLERAGPVRALRRSFRLVRRRWWPTAGALIVGYVLIAIVGGVVQYAVVIVPSLLTDGNTLATALGAVVGGTLGSVITMPYSAAVITLVYFDLRVRKEGLDLQLIAQGTGLQLDPDAPLPAPLVEEQYTAEERAQAPYWPPPPGWRPPPRAPQPSRADEAGEYGGWLSPRPPGDPPGSAGA